MRRLAALLVAGLALALGLGLSAGGSTGTPGAAKLVPADAPAFVALDTDLSSTQWQQVAGLLGGQSKLAALLSTAASRHGVDFDRDVRPALGPELDLAWLDTQNDGQDVVALLQPRDPQALATLLAKAPKPVARGSAGDWTVLAPSQAVLSRAEQALSAGGDKLADDADFQAALSSQASDALARAYVSGAGLDALAARVASGCSGLVGASWAGGSLAASDDALRLDAQAKTGEAPATAPFAPPFASEIPGGVIAYAGFADLGQGLQQLQSRCPAAAARLEAGVPLDQLASLLSGQGALYVKQGVLLPEVTLVLAAPDPAKAMATVGALVAHRGAKPQATQVDGVTVERVPVGGLLSLSYAAFDGKLVVSDSTAAIGELRATSGAKLADDAAFRAARTAAGVPDETLGLLYVDVKDALPLLKLGGAGKLPAQATDALSRVGSVVAWTTRAGDRAELHASVAFGG